ncbi:hypothetical protein ACW5XF_08230 [Aeromonas lusitana]|uniref:Uncharacterized protein n=1 Tax=Aeromonas lusitana TaxID=931529 RepID=A0A2M8HDD7_9GAMM|nr:hypothetical protein [Aeromonas lusitana]PJC94560.1 hypothetical protein CUC44_04475 [Aeromonas lusitana]
MTRTALILCMLPLGALAMEPELWLVELEHNDGIRLQFQGAELELGSADLVGIDGPDALRPGMRLAIQSRYGVAEQIQVIASAPTLAQSSQWLRAEDRLLAVAGQALLLQELGVLVFDTQTRWLNGSPADLQAGRRLVLSRDEDGRLTEVLIPNPEEDPE